MKNLHDLSRDITSSLTTILNGVVGQQLAKANRDRLAQARDLAGELSAMLSSINDGIISLDQKDDVPTESARDYWETLPPGVLRGDSAQIAQLREKSETLTQFYRAGIDIGQITKLSDHQLMISRNIGDNFGRFYRMWDRFKIAVSNNRHEMETKVEFVDEAQLFLKTLQSGNVIGRAHFEIFSIRENGWAKLPIQRIQRLHNRQTPLRFRFEFDFSYQQLITGHWFNGYAYDALKDQLHRLGVEYELYPLVTYTSRVNTALSRGEFDILARIGDQRLVIECKSGRLITDRRNDFPALIEREKALSEMLLRTRLAQGHFILIYNPYLTDRAEVDQELASYNIEAIPIDDMRGRIIDLVNSLTRK
jgi:hypothetical protein